MGWSPRDEGSGWVRSLRFQPTGISPDAFTAPSAWPFTPIQQPCVSCPPPLPTRVALAKSLTGPIVLPDLTRLSFRTNTGLAQGRRSGNEEAPGLQAAAFGLGLWEVGAQAAPSQPGPPGRACTGSGLGWDRRGGGLTRGGCKSSRSRAVWSGWARGAAITIATSATRDPPASNESRASGTGSGRGSQRKESHTRFARAVTVATGASWGEQQTLPRHRANAGDHHGNEGGIRQAGGGRGQGGQEAGPRPQGRGGVERLAHPASVGKVVV